MQPAAIECHSSLHGQATAEYRRWIAPDRLRATTPRSPEIPPPALRCFVRSGAAASHSQRFHFPLTNLPPRAPAFVVAHAPSFYLPILMQLSMPTPHPVTVSPPPLIPSSPASLVPFSPCAPVNS